MANIFQQRIRSVRIHNPKIANFRDIILIAAFSVALGYFVVVRQTQQDLDYPDSAWILNRGHTYFHGGGDSFWVYTLTYPLLVGAIDLGTRSLITAAMIVNTLSILAALSGTYLLARQFYPRPVGMLAALILGLNASFIFVGHLFQNHILFVLLVLWCVLAYLNLVRRPTNLSAVALGVMLVVALFTRVEGLVYGLFLLPAAWLIHQSTGDWRRTLRLVGIPAIMLALAFLFFTVIYIKDVDPNPATNDAYAITRILSVNPIRWDIFSRRLTDTVVNTLGHWPVWAWWIVAGWLYWLGREHAYANALLVGLILFNAAYIYLLSYWPAEHYLTHYLPYFAVLLAAALWAVAARYPMLRNWLALVVVAACIPGLLRIAGYTTPFAYRESPHVQEGVAIDTWLTEQGWHNVPVYTMCTKILPFSDSNLQYVQKFANNWNLNTPPLVFARVQQKDALFMVCSETLNWPDWKAYYANPERFPYKLKSVGSVGEYTFYQVTGG